MPSRRVAIANKELADDEGTLFFVHTSKDVEKKKTPVNIRTEENFINHYHHQTDTLVSWTQRSKHCKVATSTHTPEAFITSKLLASCR